MLAAANWQRGGKGPRPKPIERPDPDRDRKRQAAARRLASLGHLDDAPPAIADIPESDPPPPPDEL